jgi:hypothetical protein
VSDINYRPYIYGFQALAMCIFHHITIILMLTSVYIIYSAPLLFYNTIYSVISKRYAYLNTPMF